jgi:hypothetical protein
MQVHPGADYIFNPDESEVVYKPKRDHTLVIKNVPSR